MIEPPLVVHAEGARYTPEVLHMLQGPPEEQAKV